MKFRNSLRDTLRSRRYPQRAPASANSPHVTVFLPVAACLITGGRLTHNRIVTSKGSQSPVYVCVLFRARVGGELWTWPSVLKGGVVKRKLVEVALPLEAINRESIREKSIRHGHPSTIHLWWARRPLATARAILFAQLVDDPSAHPDQFPTEEDQEQERERLHALIEQLVLWESTTDSAVLESARKEILRSTQGNPPPILDPFAGGGTIPLEAQRLGLTARASDLNPVAVLINRALIEIPPKFKDRTPVFPGQAETKLGGWKGPEGLAADVRAYGEWLRQEAEKEIGHLYPKAHVDGQEADVIAWIWARTVTCPNPACAIDLPLVRSWWLGKRKGREAYVVPYIIEDSSHPSGKRISFTIGNDPEEGPTTASDGTMSGRRGAVCIACDTPVDVEYIKSQGRGGKVGSTLIATVVKVDRRRIYVAPTQEHVAAAAVKTPADVPREKLGHDPRNLWTPPYGLDTYATLFTPRQLKALTTFGDLVSKAREKVVADARATSMELGARLAHGGTGAEAYGDAVATYLAMVVSKCADYWSSICSWHVTGEKMRNVFGRQAIPMVWDYAEAMPFSDASGGYLGQLDWVAKAIERTPADFPATAIQADASTTDALASALISTDPPYYDNIGYSDLSDYFYVWQRRMLRDIHPDLFRTMLVPKAEELVANQYRHGGKEGARNFFEDGFQRVFARARETAFTDYPITVYYAFKQADRGEDGTSSTGWETLLEGMIRAGWMITATWPVRSELSNRMLASGTNALASSIVLALRPRPQDAPAVDRRGFIAALQEELPPALRSLQQANVSPVDLPQASIGPGMAVYSRYSAVYEPDGTPMTVRSALARINEILDEVVSDQEGEFNAETRFAIAWYRQHGYETGSFGDADNIARSRNSSVESLDREGILQSRAGKVWLIKPEDYPEDYDVVDDARTGPWEAAHHLMRLLNTTGVAAAGEFLVQAQKREDSAIRKDQISQLAHLLFRIADEHGRTHDALNFNALITSWADITQHAQDTGIQNIQSELDLEGE